MAKLPAYGRLAVAGESSLQLVASPIGASWLWIRAPEPPRPGLASLPPLDQIFSRCSGVSKGLRQVVELVVSPIGTSWRRLRGWLLWLWPSAHKPSRPGLASLPALDQIFSPWPGVWKGLREVVELVVSPTGTSWGWILWPPAEPAGTRLAPCHAAGSFLLAGPQICGVGQDPL